MNKVVGIKSTWSVFILLDQVILSSLFVPVCFSYLDDATYVVVSIWSYSHITKLLGHLEQELKRQECLKDAMIACCNRREQKAAFKRADIFRFY